MAIDVYYNGAKSQYKLNHILGCTKMMSFIVNNAYFKIIKFVNFFQFRVA
jgi:hypothetical protein